MNEYVQLEELKATMELTGFSFADEDGRKCIEAASRSVDAMTGRVFYLGPENQARYFTAVDPSYVRIDDAAAVTLVEIDTADTGTWTTLASATDYWLEPRNATVLGVPYSKILLRPGYSGYFGSTYPSTVRVTGTFGWETVPPEVRTYTSILATKLLKRTREAPFGIVAIGIDEPSAMRIARTDPDFQTLLGPYVRTRILN